MAPARLVLSYMKEVVGRSSPVSGIFAWSSPFFTPVRIFFKVLRPGFNCGKLLLIWGFGHELLVLGLRGIERLGRVRCLFLFLLPSRRSYEGQYYRGHFSGTGKMAGAHSINDSDAAYRKCAAS